MPKGRIGIGDITDYIPNPPKLPKRPRARKVAESYSQSKTRRKATKKGFKRNADGSFNFPKSMSAEDSATRNLVREKPQRKINPTTRRDLSLYQLPRVYKRGNK